MATTAAHISARGDADLLQRFIARAEQMDIDGGSSWIQNNMGKLISTAVEGDQTITDVYAYANNVRQEYINNIPPRPGENPGAVTDAQLATAINKVRADETAAN